MSRFKGTVAALWCLLGMVTSVMPGETGAENDDNLFNFGHIGVDFKVHHTYRLINILDVPLQITGVDAPCECSHVILHDSLAEPGDTVYFDLAFSTKNLYGPTNKSFSLLTDHPEHPELQYVVQAFVGQWPHALKPEPLSFMFLPGQPVAKSLRIPNRLFEEISVLSVRQHDSSFTVQIRRNTADRGGALEFEVSANEQLGPGTYNSNFTVTLGKKGIDELTVITLPVKVVKY